MNPILFRSLYLCTTYEPDHRSKPMITFADRKGGFPHSEISGSKGARASPELIAACYVLHRLSMPRHPSEALMRLIVLSKTHAWGRWRELTREQIQPIPHIRFVDCLMS